MTLASCETGSSTLHLCTGCGNSFVPDYTDALGHSWDNGTTVTDATGHSMSDWIIDKEPTTDTHGEAVIGGYLVIVTDTDTKNPVSSAGVALDKAGSISIRLPNSRLLDYADQTTVTVLLYQDKTPVTDMQLAVTDKNTNYCADKTDKAGQITVPGTSGSTNDNGKTTGVYEDADGECFTLTVKVEDNVTGRPIEDAGISIGKTSRITVVLPDVVDIDENNRITVTVTDHEKQLQEDLSVLIKGDLKQIVEGVTDENG